MNREFLPEAVVGITLALLLAVLAVYRTTKETPKPVMSRGAVMALLTYAVIAAQALVTTGLTLLGLVVLLILVALPVAGMVLVTRMGWELPGGSRGSGLAGDLVSVGLAAAMLIAAGQTLSMLGLVDPRTVVIVLAVVAALLVARNGLAGSSRIASLAVWLLILPILISLALGVFLGGFGEVVSPIITVDGMSPAVVVFLALAFLVIGATHVSLRAACDGAGPAPGRVFGFTYAILLLLTIGALMFLGGAIVAPSVQFFVVPANLDAVPGLAGVVLAVLTLLFAALVANAFAGLRPKSDSGDVRLFAAGAGLAAVVALVDPGLDWVVVATALVAAGVAAATTDRGVSVGLAAAAVAVVVLTFTGAATYGWWAVVALVVVAAVGAVASKVGAPAAPAETVPVGSGATP